MSNTTHHFYTFRNHRRSEAVSDPQTEATEQSARESQIISIIEYSAKKKARNSYPFKIISPPSPGRCCTAHMDRIGQIQVEGDRKFYYKRCTRCGFTVREFVSPIDLDRMLSAGVSDWDHGRTWLDRIQHEVETERAA